MQNNCNEISKYITCNKVEIEYYDTLPSTNLFLKEHAAKHKEGLTIIAGTQTKGRGRFDRKFYSPEDSGIYMSILLRPDFSDFDATLITSAAAVAVAKAAEKLSGKKTQIKWVNDVLIDGKKICGILTEAAIDPKIGKPEYVVLGIGINAFAPAGGFDDEIKDIAGFVFDDKDSNAKARLTAEVINLFMHYYENLRERKFLTEYRKRSMVIGKKITVIKNSQKTDATAISIDEHCRLLVEYENRTREFLSSGEVSIKIE